MLAKKMRVSVVNEEEKKVGEDEEELMREVGRMTAKRALEVESQKKRMGDLEANLKEQLKLEQVRH